jgi:hypothetical protein
MWWRVAAEVYAEDALAKLPEWHPERRVLTALLATIRLGPAALVNEYRAWRSDFPELVAAMTYGGRRSDARLQAKYARIARNIWRTTDRS